MLIIDVVKQLQETKFIPGHFYRRLEKYKKECGGELYVCIQTTNGFLLYSLNAITCISIIFTTLNELNERCGKAFEEYPISKITFE